MYKEETRRRIETALGEILAHNGRWQAPSLDAERASQDICQLSKLLADQLWVTGYELEMRNPHVHPLEFMVRDDE